MFKSVEECIELFRDGVTSDTGFEYVYNCEEVDLDGNGEQDFNLDANYFDQINEIRHYGDIQAVEQGRQPYAEFTRVICPAYAKD